MAETKKAVWLSKIESREDALKLARETSIAFFLFAGLLAIESFIFDWPLLIDAAVYAAGGFFVRRFNSRVAAVILLLFSIAGAAFSFTNAAAAKLSGGISLALVILGIILALIILAAAIRAVEATFKLQGRFASGAGER